MASVPKWWYNWFILYKFYVMLNENASAGKNYVYQNIMVFSLADTRKYILTRLWSKGLELFVELTCLVRIAPGYGLDNQRVGVWVLVGSRNFSRWLWGLPSLPSSGYHGPFPWEYSNQGMKLNRHRQVVLKKMWICISTPPYFFMV
jgi:hypothetical protein